MTQDMINKIMTLNKTSLRLTCDEITARASRDYGSCFTRFLRPLDGVWRCNRLVVTLLLMMVVGVNGVKAQETPDYSGTYYIAYFGNNKYDPNDPTNTDNHYWCPVDCSGTWKAWFKYNDDPNYDNYSKTENTEMEFLTTYRFKKDSNYDSQNALWVITKHETIANAYYIQHSATQKYLTLNDYMEGTTNTGQNRLRVHIQSDIASDNKSLFTIKQSTQGVYFLICPFSLDGKQWVNVSTDATNANKQNKDANSLIGTDTKGGVSGLNVGGTLGYYSSGDGDNNSKWYLEIPSPTFSLNTNSEVEISALGDAEIYYTTDGTVPGVPAANTEPTGTTSKYELAIPLENNQVMIKAIATNKGHIVNSSIITYVYNPDITWTETSFEYNGSPQVPTVTSVKVGENVVPAEEYDISCTDNTNVGTATLTLTDKVAGNNYIVSGSTTFEIAQREATLAWSDTELQYTGSAQQPTATVSNLVGEDACTVTVTGGQTNVGSYTATATALSNTNYTLPATATQTFTITPKSLGDGASIADGIDVTVSKSGDSYVLLVKNGELTLTEGSDYTTTTSGQEVTITAVTGEGKNYTGSGIIVTMDSEDIDASETDEYVATYKSSRDLVTPTGMTAYVVTAVDVEAGTVTVSSVDYIPNGVPVLLSADATFSGFSIKTTTPETPFSGTNLLQMASGTDAERTVELAQVYVYYHGEFVLTMEGTLTEGKFYLNNPTYPSAAPKFNALRIVRSEATKVDNGSIMKKEESSMKKWYTIDGRHLNAKPTRKGLYICNGKKVIMK